eukprot:6198371-Pleurochrysis_carterae.AAC.5
MRERVCACARLREGATHGLVPPSFLRSARLKLFDRKTRPSSFSMACQRLRSLIVKSTRAVKSYSVSKKTRSWQAAAKT